MHIWKAGAVPLIGPCKAGEDLELADAELQQWFVNGVLTSQWSGQSDLAVVGGQVVHFPKTR
jgi:hypothetical protein